MSRFGPRRSLICPVLVLLLWAAGCDREVGVPSDARTNQHPVPFQGAETPSVHPASTAPVPDNSEAGLPFHNSQNLPAGTLLTVRLKNPIFALNPGSSNPGAANPGASNPSADGTFEAVLDEPVVIEGNKLVPRGTPVEGRVESARASNVGHNRGYIRLALDSMHVADANLPIQTASLFVRGSSGDSQNPPGNASAAGIRLEKGRRLTFRLTESADVAFGRHTPVER